MKPTRWLSLQVLTVSRSRRNISYFAEPTTSGTAASARAPEREPGFPFGEDFPFGIESATIRPSARGEPIQGYRYRLSPQSQAHLRLEQVRDSQQRRRGQYDGFHELTVSATGDSGIRLDLSRTNCSRLHAPWRRLDLTRQVDPTLIEQCLELASKPPARQSTWSWSFVVVTDPDKRQALGTLYKRGWDAYLQTIQSRVASEAMAATPSRDRLRAYRSAYLADHMGEVPVLVIPCIAGRTDGASADVQASWGSILPRSGASCSPLAPGDWAPAGTALPHEREAAGCSAS